MPKDELEIIWGPTMSGKSLLGLKIAAEKVRRGEAVLVMPCLEFSEKDINKRVKAALEGTCPVKKS